MRIAEGGIETEDGIILLKFDLKEVIVKVDELPEAVPTDISETNYPPVASFILGIIILRTHQRRSRFQ